VLELYHLIWWNLEFFAREIMPYFR
jgi:hypothetical protein